jgi:hypothetical protein
MSQSHFSNIALPEYPNRLNNRLFHSLRALLQPITENYAASIPELLVQIQKVSTPFQLTKLVNKLQHRIWDLLPENQTLARKQLLDALNSVVLHASESSLRLEAAAWLRFFTYAAYPSQPEEIFVTLVTAATLHGSECKGEETNEQHAYLQMIFDCFWPFRYPYATYNWEKFPNNSIFYPLAPLLSHADTYTQDILISIFAELPSLDDAEIAEYMLPIALQWSTDISPERRQRITTILALMHSNEAQDALNRLQTDSHLLVSCKAKRAAEKVQTT